MKANIVSSFKKPEPSFFLIDSYSAFKPPN